MPSGVSMSGPSEARPPRWLGERMARLGAVISEAIVLAYGRDELLRRLAHPFWFQSFGAVMGMDWHSSGITTSVIGALKRGLDRVRLLELYLAFGFAMHVGIEALMEVGPFCFAALALYPAAIAPERLALASGEALVVGVVGNGPMSE